MSPLIATDLTEESNEEYFVLAGYLNVNLNYIY